MKIGKLVFSAAVAMATATGAASATVYTINSDQDVFPATVTGTITTDGALGVLSQSDVTGVNLTVTDLFGSAVVNTDPIVSGTDLTATAGGLFFSFDGGAFEYFVVYSSDFGSAYCLATGSPTCAGTPDSEVLEVNGALYQGPVLTGSTVEIATAGGVPEPMAWTLMLVGIGVVGGSVRRQQRSSVAA